MYYRLAASPVSVKETLSPHGTAEQVGSALTLSSGKRVQLPSFHFQKTVVLRLPPNKRDQLSVFCYKMLCNNVLMFPRSLCIRPINLM